MGKQKAYIAVNAAKCLPCSGLVCLGVCPEGVLELDSNRKPKVADESACTLCGVCVNLCPTKALSVKKEDEGKKPR